MKQITFSDILIFENEDYCIVDKPPHFSSLDERLGEAINLQQIVRAALPDAQLAHRLDKETSGALAIAKHPEAYRHLAIQFQKREVYKTYHAFVDGVFDFKDEIVDMPLSKTSQGLARIDHSGKEAITVFNTLHAYRHHTLLACRPLTGRLHQIRIHASLLKAPLMSDPQYGGKMFMLSSIKRNFHIKKWTQEQPLMQRVALHAYQLEFEGLQGEKITATAPYPKDFRAVKKQLDKFDRL
ncbi:MAG: RNA pseudouridine synthase [Bernardetiaceae bacterium]|nr:RNA pseudouridine synthase [Bernardetiaceae bacterium]